MGASGGTWGRAPGAPDFKFENRAFDAQIVFYCVLLYSHCTGYKFWGSPIKTTVYEGGTSAQGAPSLKRLSGTLSTSAWRDSSCAESYSIQGTMYT